MNLLRLLHTFALFASMSILMACSNSEYASDISAGGDEFIDTTQCEKFPAAIDSSIGLANSIISTAIQDSSNLFLDDSTYPYTGLPRIVIETANSCAIKNRTTEVPAKLQIWGEYGPESPVMDLIIKGRGNVTWSYPKKPYTIKFSEKYALLGMPKAKKWVLLANYRDRTLIRNAVALELAKEASFAWTPQGKFVDVYLNKVFLGNYYVCEKIEVKKNRLELDEEAFLLEFDTYHSDEPKFRTEYNNFRVNIKYPQEPNDSQMNYIKGFINSAEFALQSHDNDDNYLNYIDPNSFAKYFIIYALTTNGELIHPKSAYMYKNVEKLYSGPVWDFDYNTFDPQKKGFTNQFAPFVSQFLKKADFKKIMQEEWMNNRSRFSDIGPFIDSLASYISASEEINSVLWPIILEENKVGDEEKSFEEAVATLKNVLRTKILELDTIIGRI